MKTRISLKYMIFVILIILADRLAKIFMEAKAKNYGAAFGILEGHNSLFILTSFFLLGIASYYALNSNSNILILSLSFISAGITGNLIDRLFYGYVIDVIKLPLIEFPAFNIADLSSLLGAVLLVAYISKERVLENTISREKQK